MIRNERSTILLPRAIAQAFITFEKVIETEEKKRERKKVHASGETDEK